LFTGTFSGTKGCPFPLLATPHNRFNPYNLPAHDPHLPQNRPYRQTGSPPPADEKEQAAPCRDFASIKGGGGMRNGFLGSILSLLLAVSLAPAQTLPDVPPPAGYQGIETPPWQPPRPDLSDRPNVSPAGYRYYGSIDYILWWTERDHAVPPPAPASRDDTPNPAMPPGMDFGALLRNGLRGELGMWLDAQQTCAVEAGAFSVDNRSPGYQGETGTVGMQTQLHNELWGADVQARVEICRGTWAHFDLLAGFQYLSLDEGLNLLEGDSIADVITFDQFGAHNRFYGGQLGGEMVLHSEKCSVDFWGKVALGVNDETIDVAGATFAGGQTFAGGILASPALIGSHHHDPFAVLPQFGVNFGYEITQHMRATAGYTFLYLSEVARPGSQIDALLATPRPSAFIFQGSSFWAQGLNLGVEFRF
jgi:Putative beta barrel porin-7 (BBP7)